LESSSIVCCVPCVRVVRVRRGDEFVQQPRRRGNRWRPARCPPASSGCRPATA
jgi:hypothetical protein